MTVWILMVYISGFQAGGPTVIDNIATREECLRVQDVIQPWKNGSTQLKCIEVRKVKP